MSNNADFDALASELRALRQADGTSSRSGTESVLVARLLPGFSVNRWQEFLRRYPTGRWCALPAGPGLLPDMGGGTGNAPDHLAHLLMAEMFTVQIQRELLRLSRTGGDLALVEAGLCDREHLEARLGLPTVQALEARLVDCLRQCREECDTLGCTGAGRFALLLPGVGVLRARLMGEQIQKIFAVHAAEVTAGSGKGKNAVKAVCALGIACADQGGRPTQRPCWARPPRPCMRPLRKSTGIFALRAALPLNPETRLYNPAKNAFSSLGETDGQYDIEHCPAERQRRRGQNKHVAQYSLRTAPDGF